jgi:predicted anti-sigma-YlaC factor YlaD
VITCREVVEIVGDYLGGVLQPADHARFEQHLHACTWCMTYLDQVRDTIELTGHLAAPAPVDPAAKQTLLESFRRWKERK